MRISRIGCRKRRWWSEAIRCGEGDLMVKRTLVALFEGDAEGDGLRLLGRTTNARLVRLVRERLDKDKAKRKEHEERLKGVRERGESREREARD